MLMIRELLAHSSNYTAMTGRNIKYIVIHYTANDGDTAQGNCRYFNAANRKASAHYFVDEQEVWRSVKDKDSDGRYYFMPAAWQAFKRALTGQEDDDVIVTYQKIKDVPDHGRIRPSGQTGLTQGRF